MQVDHSHRPEDVASRLAAGSSSFLRDSVYGGIDGAVTTFAIVAGVAGADLSDRIIVVLGCANILADGFSMAAGNFSGTKADLDDRARIVAIEHRHILEDPAGEREELRQILHARGLSGLVLEQAVAEISAQTSKWVDLMLTDEYGLPRDAPRPWRSAAATFVAFMIAGTVPLAPFLLGLEDPFLVSVLATLATFFAIGALKSRWSLNAWWWSGTETLAIGSVAAAVAYAVGRLFTA